MIVVLLQRILKHKGQLSLNLFIISHYYSSRMPLDLPELQKCQVNEQLLKLTRTRNADFVANNIFFFLY